MELPLQGKQKQNSKELLSQETQKMPLQQELPLQGMQEQPLQESQELPLQGTQIEKTKSPLVQSGSQIEAQSSSQNKEAKSSSQIDHLVHQHKELPTVLVTDSESANVEAEGAPEVSVLESSHSSSAETTSSPISSIDISNQQQTTVNKISDNYSTANMHVGKSHNSNLPVEIRRSPSLEAPELVISVSPGISSHKLPVVEVTAKLPVVSNPVEVTKEVTIDGENDQSSESIPVFVSEAPTGLTSPVALRPNIEGSSKRDLLDDEDEVIKEKSPKKPNKNNVTGDKNHFIVAPRHTSKPLKKRKQRQSVDAEFSLSIAERTRSRAKGGGQSASSILKKTAKRESRELNRLVVDMNGYDVPKNNMHRKRKSLNKFRKANVKKCRSNIDGIGMYICLHYA